MIQSSRIIIIPVVLLLFLACSQPVHADGKIFSVYGDVGEPGQEALIMMDENIETLILRIQLQGEAKDLGWVIPLPSYPEVSEGDKRLFRELEMLTMPPDQPTFSMKSKHRSKITGGLDLISVETAIVGIYEVNKIKADDTTALFNWLNEHNFKQDESVKQLLDEYIQKKFCFVAVKIDLKQWDEEHPEDTQKNSESDRFRELWQYTTWLDPLRFEFESDKWFYPMKISSQNKGRTELIIWAASNKMMTFPKAKTQWAEFVRLSDIFEYFSSITHVLPGDTFLTRLSWSVRNSQIKSDIILKENYIGYYIKLTSYYAGKSVYFLQTPFRYLRSGTKEVREYFIYQISRGLHEIKVKAHNNRLEFMLGWEGFWDRYCNLERGTIFILCITIALLLGIIIGWFSHRQQKSEE